MLRFVFCIAAFYAMMPAVVGCSCVFIPTFCETITYPSGDIDSMLLIVHGKVEGKTADEMQVRVIDVLFGAVEENILRIPNGDGADCQEFISKFSMGDTYLFALRPSIHGRYHLSTCGVTWLEVRHGMVYGAIAPGVSKITFNAFANLPDCGDLSGDLTSIVVLPTLATNSLKIHSTADADDVTMTLYDMAGRLTWRQAGLYLHANEAYDLDIRGFAAGCYVLVIDINDRREVVRFAVIPES